jgi:hypothetical protein
MVTIMVIVIVKVALVFRHIQWHSNFDPCIGEHIGHLLLRDKDNTNQWLHKSCAKGSLHLQASVVQGP